MAEKDANYYYNRAAQARANGNERLAQMMESYAIQLDRDYGSGEAGREGAARPVGRYEDANVRGWDIGASNQRMAELQRQYNAMQARNNYDRKASQVIQPTASWTTGDPEAQMEADFRAKQGVPADGVSIYDYSRDMRAGRYGDNVVGVGGDIRNINPDDYRDGEYITAGSASASRGNGARIDPKTGGVYPDPFFSDNILGPSESLQRSIRENPVHYRTYAPTPAPRAGSQGDMPTWPKFGKLIDGEALAQEYRNRNN